MVTKSVCAGCGRPVNQWRCPFCGTWNDTGTQFAFSCPTNQPDEETMRNTLRGFTLIELMIVIAIVGVLAAIALPQYQDYLIRSKLVEEITFLDAAKISLTEAAQTQGGFPTISPISTTVPVNAKYMAAVNYNVSGANASVVTTLANTGSATVNGTFVGIFGLLNTDGTVTWTCGTATAATSTAAGAVGAQYPFLPASCQH